MSNQIESKALFFRNFIFGVEDSLVSTVGLLSGIASAGIPRTDILLTGVVLIFVEGFSMAAGSFSSELSTEEYIQGKEVSVKRSISGSITMFFSYFISGFVPLTPYVLLPVQNALPVSIGLSLVALFVLGLISAKRIGRHLLKHGIRTLIIGGVAILVGVLVGNLIK